MSRIRFATLLGAAFLLAQFGAVAAPPTEGVQSAGSKGAHTPSNEAKSTEPVPVAVAKAEPSAKMSAADQKIADKVIMALNSEQTLNGARITVLAANGDVTLSGKARDQAQADKAMALAQVAAGSGKVTNSLAASSG